MYSQMQYVHEMNGYLKVLDEQVIKDVVRIVSSEEENYLPQNPSELCKRILFTCYLGTENSSQETKQRAEALALQIGSQHSKFSLFFI